MLHEVFYWVLSMSITAAITGGIVWPVTAIRPLPRRAAVLLWVIPFVRMAVPLGMNSPHSVLSLLAHVATKTVTVCQPINNVAFSMTNCVTMADSYFPVTYKVDVLETVFTVAAVMWLIGAAALFVLMAVVYRSAVREAKTATRQEGNVYVSDACRSPAVYGIFKPIIVLPSSLKEEERAVVLLHERAHIRRKDHQRIDIGYSRPNEAILSGENFLHHTLSLFDGDFHKISGQGGIAAAAQTAPPPAGYSAVGGADFIKAAETANDAACCPFHHQLNTTS